ncbi:MAG: HlyD family secretion protein [Planctomycetaceae bacterium]|nr:HlyD family secretion protein [Planctomycetaceae bacterium]
MSWILGGVYCGFLWLVFDRLKLLRLSLPLAILFGSVGPALIVVFLLLAQYLHPYTTTAKVFERVVPIVPQLSRAGRITNVAVQANTPVPRGALLFEVDPVPYQNAVARLEAAVREAEQGKDVADASVAVAQASLTQSEAELKYATEERERVTGLFDRGSSSQQELDRAVNLFAQSDAAVAQTKATLAQAKLSVSLAIARIDQAKTQLADARYDLSQTKVYAPDDGFVTNLQLQPGMLVGGGGTASVMSFVVNNTQQNTGVVVATFNQKNYLRIRQGQYAEVALFGYPGRIFTGRVENTIDVSGAGQLTASGILPSNLGPAEQVKFAVRIRLDETELRIPGGSEAMVAVYTDDVQIAGIPIMFLMRTNSWLRYLM